MDKTTTKTTTKPGTAAAPDPGRRRFLRAAGGAGALGALAAVAGQAQLDNATPPPAAGAEPATQAGYHETEHIRQYYRTARYW